MVDEVRIPHDQRAHESLLPWQKGWQTLKAIWPQLIYISLLTVSIPQCLLAWIQARKAFEAGASFDFKPTFSLAESLIFLKDFVVAYIGWAILLFLIGFWGYLTAIALVLQRKRSLPLSIPSAAFDALKALPRGILILAIAFGSAFFLLQLALQIPGVGFFLQFLIILVAVVLAGLPVLLLVEPKSPLRTLRSALRMSYAVNSGYGRWSTFFVILSFEMLLMGGYSLLDFLVMKLNFLDVSLSLPRELWAQSTDFFPFGIVPALVDLLKFTLEGLLAMSFATFTASFILELSYRSHLGERIEVLT